MSGLSARLSAFLELQILSINVLGIIRLIWSWIREWEKLGVEHILNLPISQHANGKDSWYKTILLWITNVRFIIDRITIFAYASNIITILARSWWNLLILWMLLSSIQAVLEVVIIVTMSLLWYKENVPTLKFVEFIVEKLFWFVTSSYEWCTILKWYMRLRKAEKLRKFMIISRRSIADISQVPGRVGHSLDDELLAVAETRRGKYASTASLLNLDSLSEESNRANFELRISKSLSTRISDNSHESSNSNDCDSIVNDLSVAEKSMKLLRITAEDMMDARARIHERSHWSEQNVSRETSKAVEEIVAEVILEKERTEINMNEFMNNEQVVKEATNSTSRKKVDIQNSLTEGEREKDDRKKLLVERREDSSEKRTEADVKSQDVVLQRKENPEISEKFVQCPSESRRNGNFQPTASTSLVKKLEAKLDFIPASHEKGIDSNNRPRGVKTSRLTPTNSSIDKKEYYEDLRVSSCEFHRAMYTNSALLRNGSCIRSAVDDTDKDVRDDVDRKEAKHSASPTNIQIKKRNGYNSRLNYSEIYRLKKQIQKSNKPCGKRPVTWGSKSLAQTARPSGYAKNFVAADRSRFICQNAHTEIFDEPSDSSSARSKLKQVGQIENKRSVELRSVYNVISRKRRNYAKSEKHEAELLTSDNNPVLLKDKRDVRARKRCVLSPKTLSIEEREAIERTALRAYNELTLLEDKKRLEVKKERDSSLNCAQSTRELNVPERQVHEDFTLLRDKQETETIRRHNPSLSREQSNEESIVSKPRDELTSSGDKKEKRETPSNYEETVKVSTEMIRTVSNRLPESSHEETVNCPSFETRVNTNSSEGNDRPVRRHRLNLREITRNIEWTVHPEGIVLANKSLRSQFSSERLRERQRDIVDDNTASMLHSAFFFKPEIVTRIFRRAQLTTNESSPTVAPRRQDFSTDFACRMNNEVIVQDQNTLFDLDLEQMMERSGCSLFSNVNTDDNTSNNRVTEEESNRNSYVISVGLEQIVPESVTASTENSAIEPQEDILAASGLVEPHEEENAIITDSPLQFVTDILRNIDTEGILGRTSSNEQLEDRSMNNVIVDYDFRPEKLSTDDTSFIEENNNECDGNLLDRSANIVGIINDPSRQLLDSNNDCLDNNASFVNSTGENNPHNSQDDKYLKATDIYPENKVYKNNLFLKSSDNDATSQLSENNNDKNNNNNNNSNNLLDAVINKAERIVFNHDLESSSKLSFPGPSSVIESDNCHASIVRSNENLQRFTQLSDSEAMIENQRSKSINSGANDDTSLQFWTLENTKFKTEAQDIARSENKVIDICETTSEIPMTGFLEMNSEQLRQDDSFYSTYERDKSETPISLEGGSLMEEFSDNTIPPAMSSYSQAFKSSTQS